MCDAIIERFETEIQNAVDICKTELDYNPTRFIQMVSKYRAVETAKRLLSNDEWQEGLGTLIMKGRPDLSIEAHVVKPEFKTLFTEEQIAEAQRRLGS
jgi:hypothetical protein